jgi:N-methylhydantoinase A
LHVGPVSAGADPGPACYGRGATDPVITDADLVLGRLNGNRFLGGGMSLDRNLAERAIETAVAKPLGLDVMEAALGIVKIADASMSLAVRAVSVNRGIDPRDTVMIAFGGAGPLHALAIARDIFVPTVIIPRLPGNFSALGMLMAEWRQDFVRTFFGAFGSIDPAFAKTAFDELHAAGVEALGRDGFAASEGRFAFAADLRYRGQEHTIPIAVGAAGDLTIDTAATARRFNEQHDRRYGHAAPDQSVEIVNLRLVVTVPRSDDAVSELLSTPWEVTDPAPEQARSVVFDDPHAPLEARVLWRPALSAGQEIIGPAVIEEANSTILLHPGDRAVVHPWGHLIITLAAAS